MWIRFLGDLVSPPRCAGCSGAVDRATHVFCSACASTVEPCPLRLDAVAFAYYGGALATAIQRFKYEDCPHLARPLGALVRHACRRAKLTADVVVPVPLHPRRLAFRGYNQSALLGHQIADELGAKFRARALERVVDTIPQVELSGEARRCNVGSAFRVAPSAAIASKAIALVDDVSTTGATLAACRQALFDAGAKSVTSVVVARTPSSGLGISAESHAEGQNLQLFGG